MADTFPAPRPHLHAGCWQLQQLTAGELKIDDSRVADRGQQRHALIPRQPAIPPGELPGSSSRLQAPE